MSDALVTDLYEVTMALSYLREGMTGPATFSLFVRELPPDRGFLVAAGLESVLDFLEHLEITDEDVAGLATALGRAPEGVEVLRGLRFTGDAWAVPEGRVVVANEPLLEVTAPMPQAQLVETYVLNQINYQTMLASKAARCVLAAKGRPLIDFGLRRTHGVEAGMHAARVAAMVGFVATSNVAGSLRYGLPAAGTMAHSYVEAFPDEQTAFRAFAAGTPGPVTFLVDTFDTEQGVRIAAGVLHDLRRGPGCGIRLDSGDIGALATRARAILDEAGLEDVRVIASGGLDEFAVHDLVTAGAPIDVYAVGTKVGTSADRPYLDSAYKLVRYAGQPVMKLSPGKLTLPGAKQVFRRRPYDDVISLRDEPAPPGSEALLRPVMLEGRRLEPPEPLASMRDRLRADLAELPETARLVRDPRAPVARVSDQLRSLTDMLSGSRRVP